MKVAVVGSRDANDITLQEIIEAIPQNCTEIVSGGAKGIDSMAKEVAKKLGCIYTEFLPDYESYGKQAPQMRNIQIAEYSHLVLAFWDLHSHGTRNMLDACIRLRIPFRIIPIIPAPTAENQQMTL